MDTVEEVQQSIHPVDEDHALLLGQMKSIEDAISLLGEDDQDDSHVLPVLARLRQYFLSDLLPHLKKEEEEFLPDVRRFVANGVAKVARVQEEHGQLRRRIEEFRTAYTLVNYVGPQARHELLWRLINEARAIFAQLKTHAAFEFALVRELSSATRGGNSPRNGNGATSAPAAQRRGCRIAPVAANRRSNSRHRLQLLQLSVRHSQFLPPTPPVTALRSPSLRSAWSQPPASSGR